MLLTLCFTIGLFSLREKKNSLWQFIYEISSSKHLVLLNLLHCVLLICEIIKPFHYAFIWQLVGFDSLAQVQSHINNLTKILIDF